MADIRTSEDPWGDIFQRLIEKSGDKLWASWIILDIEHTLGGVLPIAAEPSPVTTIIAAARELLDRVTYDSDGIMIGVQRQGGNGGLLSNETLAATDQLRKALEVLEQ